MLKLILLAATDIFKKKLSDAVKENNCVYDSFKGFILGFSSQILYVFIKVPKYIRIGLFKWSLNMKAFNYAISIDI